MKYPRLTNIISRQKSVTNVTCFSDDELWTSGGDKTLRLFNIKGKLLKEIITTSGYPPLDIAVTRSAEFVYIDYNEESINIVNDADKRSTFN